VRDLAVASVAHRCRNEQGRRLAIGETRQESRKPFRKIVGWQHPGHAQRLDQRRRQELIATRLPGLAVPVSAEAVDGPFADRVGQHVVECLCPFQRQDQREGGVEVGADADRIGQLAKIGAQSLCEGTGQRLQLGGPAAIVMTRGFQVKVEQPAPAVGPFEPGRERPVEIGKLGRYLFGGEAVVCQIGNGRSFFDPWKQSPQSQQRPPAMDAAVPVEAAVEDRMELARRPSVLIAEQHMVELVRIFLGDVAQRDAGELARQLSIELHRNASQ
jgi:hypothetical protein